MLKNILKKFKISLNKSASYISDGIANIFLNKKLDSQTLQELEDLLISADIGIDASSQIVKSIAALKLKKDIEAQEIKMIICDEIQRILYGSKPSFEYLDCKPQVIFLCGVNGNGKTTTIGKLAWRFKKEGKTVMIAACDTFRAAAIEQLNAWAQKVGCNFFADHLAKDPASVAYKAYLSAQNQNIDILLIDTAGRLHTHNNLMSELQKIRSVIGKLNKDAPHNTILALDATTGQNALNQINAFKEKIKIDSLVITKMDGTAKGGVVVAAAKEYPDICIDYIGTGEKIEDLEIFCPEQFAKNLLGLPINC